MQITYHDNTKLSLHTVHGSVRISSHELLLVDSTPEKTELTIDKQGNQSEKAPQANQTKTRNAKKKK